MAQRILLIEDNPDIHLMIKYVLMHGGYEFYSAYDGEEGLSKVLEIRPDLIILDLMMPKMSGEEVFQHLQGDPKYQEFKTTPVIMLTARQTSQSRIDSLLEQGLAAFLYKPFGQSELLNVIRNILTTHKIQHRNRQLLEAAEEAKDFLTKLVDSLPGALFILDTGGRISYYNGGVNAELGYDTEELNGKSFEKLLGGGPFSLDQLKEMLIHQEKIANVDLTLLDREGHAVPFRISASVLRGERNRAAGYIIIGANIAELKRLEKELIEKEKLTMFMETAVAVNHEINNPLSPILGNVQLLLQQKENFSGDTVQKLETIYRNALRIQEITQKLRKIRQPVQKTYIGNTTMVDLRESR